MKQAIIDLSDGNPGAVTALTDLAKTQADAPLLLSVLEEADVRGPEIWEGYDHEHDGDADAYAEYIREELWEEALA